MWAILGVNLAYKFNFLDKFLNFIIINNWNTSLIICDFLFLLKIRSNYDVAELTWENGQLAMHGLRGLPPTAPPKPKCGWAGDTLESIVHQATYPKQTHNHDPNPTNKWAETSGTAHVGPAFEKKRVWSGSDQCGRNFGSGIVEREERSACASATFCNKECDATMMTWASF